MNTAVRGLNRRLHGAFHALSEQATHRPYSPADAKADVKWLATTEGYPMRKRWWWYKKRMVEWEEPLSMAKASDAEGMILWNVITVLADEHDLYLYEYSEDEQPFRSVGGRNKADMEKYIAEIRAAGNEERARQLEQKPRWKYREGE